MLNSRIGSYQYGGKFFWPAVEKCKSKFFDSLLQKEVVHCSRCLAGAYMEQCASFSKGISSQWKLPN